MNGAPRIPVRFSTPRWEMWLTKLIQAYVRSNLRGSTRCTFALAKRITALQAVPVTINANQQLYVDLREGLSHNLLAGSPWEHVPWEVDEQIVMRAVVQPGDVVFDIGAHIGLHTVLLSALAGPSGMVHAFEANPRRFHTLSITIDHLANTRLHPFGLSDRPGRATLFVPEDESMASLRDWTEGRVGPVDHSPCELRTADECVTGGIAKTPDFIKCDIEGGELRMFSGATRMLDTANAPIILYEANTRSAAAFGNELSAATDFLRDLAAPRYAIFHVQPGGELLHLETFRADWDHFNLLAVPHSRRPRLDAVSVLALPPAVRL